MAREREGTLARGRRSATARVRAELDPADELRHADAATRGLREQIADLEGSAKLRVVALAALAGRAPAELPVLPFDAASRGCARFAR